MCKSETPTPARPSSTPSSTVPCPTPCTITSETVATSPADRTRTKIGVGEEVTLTVAPAPATWAITSGSGTLNPNTGSHASVTFTAGDTAGNVTITATGSGCSCTITFDVIAPSNWTLIRQPGTGLLHAAGGVTCGWYGRMFIHPNDVNFYRIETNETNSQYQNGIGSYSGKNGAWHQPVGQVESAYFPIVAHTDADGSRVGMIDNIINGDPGTAARGNGPPFIAGSGNFPITWQWKIVGSATVHAFPVTRQEGELFTTGRCESRKGGNTEFTMYNDPTSTR